MSEVTQRPTDAPNDGVDAIEVYWRPGCSFCSRLLSTLSDAGATVRLHNIWEDEDARAFVRAHNSENETVPTVRLGARVVTNPPPSALVDLLRSEYPALLTTTS